MTMAKETIPHSMQERAAEIIRRSWDSYKLSPEPGQQQRRVLQQQPERRTEEQRSQMIQTVSERPRMAIH